MDDHSPKYKVGDFVRCGYDFFDFFSYWYGDEQTRSIPLYGIVVGCTEAESGFYEPVYDVYCLDGIHRYFLEDEIELV